MPVRMSITRALLVALAVFCGACSQESGGGGEDAPVRLRVAMDDTGAAGRLHKEAFAEFTAQTGIEVELLTIPKDATETLSQYRNYFSAKSDDIDVYQIDVIWPGTLGSHLVDLTGKVDAGAFFPPLIENNTVKGKLVALPWWSDAGLLYYRTDLLEKYGYDGPPTTWDELEEMSATIQAGEREERGDNSFWGYLWQGKAYEGLTCNGLEWVKSHGGGTIVDGEGNVTINNEAAAQALDRAA
ncbi:MAG: extracellular solute-binding protein, partial [Sumerlaeia bacterium]